MPHPKLIDRLRFAAHLSTGYRVLDIGGQKMPDCDPTSPFARQYAQIARAATEYRIVDVQNTPAVDYVADLNQPDGLRKLEDAIQAFQPEVILCMETLEHLNYHFEVMNRMAAAVSLFGSRVFITPPNNANWLFNALGWNQDHVIAFFKDVAERFVRRSDLGQHLIILYACMQRYLWYWSLAYALSGFQPFRWGVLIEPRQYQASV